MNNLNSVIIEGRLVKKPVSGEGRNGKPYSFATIASNRWYKPNNEEDIWREQTTYIDIRAFNGISEALSKSDSGTKVRVIGRIEMEKDDMNRNRHYILAEQIEYPTV